ncbi:MAG: T9SS type A sorting domain-containing protein [Chitinophagaceae bacterium]|nr:T9SS type A sorting domain-containing protein [Chitinophagaceae bacterium]
MAFRLKLEIENPCTENWHNMMPDEKGRFCLSCTKQVVDFSKMTDQELIRFFKQNRKTDMCGQLSDWQLNRVLIESPRRRWLPYFLQATLPAILFLNRAEAQQSRLSNDTSVVRRVVETADLKQLRLLAADSAPVVIRGKVVDHEGKPVAFASIKVVDTEQYSLTDSTGNFQIHYRGTASEVSLSCSALSFGEAVVVFSLLNEATSCTIRLQPKELPPVVIQSGSMGFLKGMVGGIVVKRTFMPLDTLTNWFKNTISKFKLYPNPARTSSTIKIELPSGYEGEVVLRLLSISGQVLQTQKYQAPKGVNVLSFPVPKVTPGTYLMQIGSVTKKEWVAEEIVIQ